MNKIFILFFICYFQSVPAQTTLTEIEKNASICYVWGLLKYRHPEVSKGQLNWNQEFINFYDKTKNVNSTEQLSQELLKWINIFENKSTKFSQRIDINRQKQLFAKNADFSWIENSNFDINLKSKLKQINKNDNYKKFYASINKLCNHLEFRNEKGYEHFDFQIKSNRILFLASFWNAMKYWNVNIYLTDEPWNDVLKNLQVDFIEADTEEKFEFAKMKLFSKLNDSHSNYNAKIITQNVYNHFAAFGVKTINDSLVITKIYNKTLAEQDGIQLKDVIIEIENKTVKDYLNDKFQFFGSASNLNYLRSQNEDWLLLSSNKDSLLIKIIDTNRKVHTKFIKLYASQNYKYENPENINAPRKERFCELSSSSAYINLEKITKDELANAFKTFSNKKGIIIDLRNYPLHISSDDLSKHLYPEKKVFAKVLAPVEPSYGEYDMQAPLKIIKNPLASGSKNKNHYKGKIVLLVNRVTGSHGEFLGMLIQQSPNCITIGEQTFGAVMNRNAVILADSTTVDFTGMGAFYPDDTSVQRNGLKLDFEVKESAFNYNPNKYIEEAMKLIEK